MKILLSNIIVLLVTFPILAQVEGDNYLGQSPPGDIPELFAPGIISSGNNDMDITISPDGTEIFFTRSGPDWYSAILYLHQTKSGWQGPVIHSCTRSYECNYPFISPDGKVLLFEAKSNSDKGDGDNRDIYRSVKSGNSWSKGEPLSNGINTEYAEMYIGMASNGNLYFSANYPESRGRFDIYQYNQNSKTTLQLDTTVNSNSSEFHAYIAPDESYIIFDSPRPGGYGGNDLYISFKNTDNSWTQAINMGESINTPYSDMRPFVTYDGKYLFFSTTRPNPQVDVAKSDFDITDFTQRIAGPGNGSQDIYWVSARIIKELKNKKQ